MSKLIRVNLGAITRHEYSCIVQVPDDYEVDDLPQMVYEYTECDQFTVDETFWERGECSADEVVPSDEAVRAKFFSPEFVITECGRFVPAQDEKGV